MTITKQHINSGPESPLRQAVRNLLDSKNLDPLEQALSVTSDPAHQEFLDGLDDEPLDPLPDPRWTRYLHTLPRRYQRYTISTLHSNAGNQQAIQVAAELKPDQNLYLFGPAGNGKTHLAVAAGFRFLEAGHSVAFWGIVELFARIRGSFNSGPPAPDLLAPDVLILDDVGKIKPTRFVFEEFYRVLESRWANEKCTIITANHRPSEAADELGMDGQSAGAIASRMAAGQVVEVTGSDQRIGRK